MYLKTSALVGIFTAFAAHAGEGSCAIQQNPQQQQQQVNCATQAPVDQAQQAPIDQAQQAQEQAQQGVEQSPTQQLTPPYQQADQVPDQQQGPTQAPVPPCDQQQQQQQQQAVAQSGYAPYVHYSYVTRDGQAKALHIRVVRHVNGADYGYLRVEAYEGYILNTNIPAKLILRHSVSQGVIYATTAVLVLNGDVVINDVPVTTVTP